MGLLVMSGEHRGVCCPCAEPAVGEPGAQKPAWGSPAGHPADRWLGMGTSASECHSHTRLSQARMDCTFAKWHCFLGSLFKMNCVFIPSLSYGLSSIFPLSGGLQCEPCPPACPHPSFLS